MNDTILAAVITGFFGLLGGLLIGYKDEIQSRMGKSKRNVTGIWTGTAFDVEISELLKYDFRLEYNLRCELKQKGKRVVGDIWVESDRFSKISIEGKFKDDDYIVVDYENTDRSTADYGVGFFRFLGTGTELKGLFIGRSIREEGIFLAYAEIQKKHAPTVQQPNKPIAGDGPSSA